MPGPALNIPQPDPSDKTLILVEHGIASLQRILEARLDGMDKANIVLSDNVNRVPTVLDREISKVSLLTTEKFSSVDIKFAALDRLLTEIAKTFALQLQERDIRSEKMELAQKEFATAQAVAAGVANTVALSAQKEAAAAQYAFLVATMTERQAATTKQVDSMLALATSNSNAINDKIAIVSQRLDSGDGRSKGESTSQSTLLAVGALAVSIVVGGFAILKDHSTSIAPVPSAVAVVPVAPK